MSDHTKGVRKAARQRVQGEERSEKGSLLRGAIVLLSVGIVAVLSGFWLGKYMVRTFLDPTPPSQQVDTSGRTNVQAANSGDSGGSNNPSSSQGAVGAPAGGNVENAAPASGGEAGSVSEATDEPAQPVTAPGAANASVLHRVRVGPYDSREDAMETLEVLQRGEYPHAYVLEGVDQKVYIQVGAFANYTSAESVRDALVAAGYPALIYTPAP